MCGKNEKSASGELCLRFGKIVCQFEISTNVFFSRPLFQRHKLYIKIIICARKMIFQTMRKRTPSPSKPRPAHPPCPCGLRMSENTESQKTESQKPQSQKPLFQRPRHQLILLFYIRFPQRHLAERRRAEHHGADTNNTRQGRGGVGWGWCLDFDRKVSANGGGMYQVFGKVLVTQRACTLGAGTTKTKRCGRGIV